MTMCIYVYVYIYIYIYIFIYVFIYIYSFMYIYIIIYIYNVCEYSVSTLNSIPYDGNFEESAMGKNYHAQHDPAWDKS